MRHDRSDQLVLRVSDLEHLKDFATLICRAWGISPRIMFWIYTAAVRPMVTYEAMANSAIGQRLKQN